MNNSDMPAMPFSEEMTRDAKAQCAGVGLPTDPFVYAGLTKREHFATMAMQGMLANPITLEINDETIRKIILVADKLLEELSNDK